MTASHDHLTPIEIRELIEQLRHIELELDVAAENATVDDVREILEELSREVAQRRETLETRG